MRIFIFAFIFIFSQLSFAGLTAESCKSKIQAAHLARTGEALNDGANNVVIDICKGIVDEIKANAQVQPGILVSIPSTAGPGSPSSGTTSGPGVIQ